MNWQNIDPPLEESKIHLSNINSNTKSEEKQNDDQIVQLKKFQDPAQNVERQACIALLAQFGDFLMNNRISDMTNNVLTEDCEFFLFSSTGRTPAKYCLDPKDLDNLYNGIQIQERIVRERYIDLEKDTAVQFCNFKVLYEGESDPVNEIVSEVFTLKNNKISKYRAFFAKMTPDHKDSDPFEITSKERALLMVKKLNYAVAGKPDLDKLAEFYHKDAKYKIWSWDSQKCFLFGKHDLKENFEKMQENFELKSIVPYAIYTESQIAVGAYIYHLEGKTGQYANKKYIWPNTCFYVFDEDYKITRVSQQGELSLEGEIEAPFEVFTRENFMQKIQKIFTTQGPKADLFYENIVDFKCALYQFGPDNQPNIGFSQGTEAVERVQKRENEGTSITKSMRLMGSVVDYCDSGYDVAVTLHCARGISDYPGYKYSGMDLDTLVLTKFSFEHGKVVKICVFLSIISEPTPSPFDDPSFESITIKPKSAF